MHVFAAFALALITLLGGTPTPIPATPEPTAEATAQYQYAVFSVPEDATDAQVQAAVSVITARLQALKVDFDPPQIDKSNSVFIRVGLPQDQSTDDLIRLITQPGYLELVDTSRLDPSAEYTGQIIWTTGQAKRLGADQSTPAPDEALFNPQTHQFFKTLIDGTQITAATVLQDQYGTSWIVQIDFNEAASRILSTFTASHIGKPLAIVIDGKIFSMPVIQAVLSSQAWLQGTFTEQQARELAAQLGSGPLPISLQFTGFLGASATERSPSG